MLTRIYGQRYLVAGILAVVVYLIGSITISGFGSVFGLRSMLVLAALLGIASIGQTLCVLLGGIDLSVPFIIGFANVAAARLGKENIPFVVVILIVLAISGLVGAANGAVSAKLRIPPLIVTLGVGNIVQGAVQVWTHGFPTGSAPQSLLKFVSIGSHTGPFAFPPLLPFWLVLSIAVLIVLRRTVFGRRLYALGASPGAAKLALVRPVRMWTSAFALSGMFSGLAGILLLGFTGSAFAGVGEPYLFQSLAAVVIGGTSMLGARGSYIGTIIGAFVLIELTTLLVGLGLTATLVQAGLGFVIIVLVSMYGRETHIRNQI